MSSTNTNSNTATVRFNVGGTIYEVSRSLLEQHPSTMLARMVSKTWLGEEEDNERKDEPLFIDRDGERFCYVLDFMRDGPIVSLPVTISKGGFLKELDYFGFDNVEPYNVSIRSSYSVYADTMKKMKTMDIINNAKNTLDRNFSVLARYCFLRFKLTGDLTVDMRKHNNSDFHRHTEYQDAKTMQDLRSYAAYWNSDPAKITCLDKYLNEYDLKLIKVDKIRTGEGANAYGIIHLCDKSS